MQQIRKRTAGAVLFVSAFVGLGLAPAQAKVAGTFDKTFGTGGQTKVPTTEATESAVAVLEQPDGKLVSVHQGTAVHLTRFTATGQLDTAYGVGGTATPPGSYQLPKAFMQSTGKTVVMGLSSARVDLNGATDFTWQSPAISSDSKVVLMPDDTFRVISTPNNETTWQMRKLSANGVVDGAYGTRTLSLPVPPGGLHHIAGAVVDGNAIVVFGVYGSQNPLVGRYDADAALDTSFGQGGIGLYLPDIPLRPTGVAIQPDGRYVVAGDVFVPGSTPQNGETYMGAMRVAHDGAFDAAYGDQGFVAVGPIGGTTGVVGDNARTLVSAQFDLSDQESAGLIVLNSSGNLDTGYTSGGVQPFGDRFFTRVLIEPSGYITTGTARLGSDSNDTLFLDKFTNVFSPSGTGYRFVASDGGIFTFGNAGFFGSEGGTKLNRPIVGMTTTPSGNGYWLVATDGGIFTHGDAGFFGSTGGVTLNKPIVGMASTPSGHGYWLVASDGGIFSFGDAAFLGSAGDFDLPAPIVGIVANATGDGYWMVGSDGSVYSFGEAVFVGDLFGTPINKPIVGMSVTPDGEGYWLTATDGGVFSFGDAPFFGSTGAVALNRPIVGVTGQPEAGGTSAPFAGDGPTSNLRTLPRERITERQHRHDS